MDLEQTEVSEECEAAWELLRKEHIIPSRMVEVAMEGKSLIGWELKHLRECEKCREWMEYWYESAGECPDCGCPSDGRCKECDDELGAGE